MCLIIRCNKDIPLNKPLMEHWCERNGDGWGMMWLQDNVIKTFKSMEDEQALWDKYLELQDYDPVIHLRWRTHGDTDLDNCHPYYCGHGIFLMHNGIISDASNRQKEKSDTWHFIEDWVKNLFALTKNPHQTMRSSVFRKMFEKEIGPNNRIIMGDRGGFVTFNDTAWHTITNEDTLVKGLVVSNTYAWDADKYGKPVYKPPVTQMTHYSGYGSHATHSTTVPRSTLIHPIKYINGSYRNTVGTEMFLVVGNIYVDLLSQVWIWTDQAFKRCPDMDKPINRRIKKELKKQEKQQEETLVPIAEPQQASLLLPPPKTEEEEQVVETYSKVDHTNILVREWRNESSAAIHSLVYTMPDEAAKVICHLMGK